MKELFKNKSFTLLFTGSLVSEIGSVLFSFAAGIYIAILTNSPIMLGLFMALGAAVRIVVSPIAGVLVDRWNKVRIIYMTDYIRGLIFIAVAYLFYIGVTDTEAKVILLVVVGLSGIIGGFFGPAVTSGIPEIVGIEHVQAANGASGIIQSVTQIFGVLFGILAFSLFDFHIALLLNGVSFMVSGFSEMFIKTKYKEEVIHDENKTMMGDFTIGFNFIRKKEGLFTLMMYSLALNFALTPLFSVGIESLFIIELGKGPWDIGWATIAFSIAMMIAGVIVGSITIRNLTKTIRTGLIGLTLSFVYMTAIIFLITEGMISYPLFYGMYILGNMMLAGSMMMTNIPLQTGMVKVIDPELRGRVFSTIGALASGAVPIAILLGAFIIEFQSVAVLGIISSIIMLFPAFGFLTNKKVTALLDGIEEDTNGRLQEAV